MLERNGDGASMYEDVRLVVEESFAELCMEFAEEHGIDPGELMGYGVVDTCVDVETEIDEGILGMEGVSEFDDAEGAREHLQVCKWWLWRLTFDREYLDKSVREVLGDPQAKIQRRLRLKMCLPREEGKWREN